VLETDEKGRIRLSMKAVSNETAQQAQPQQSSGETRQPQ